MRSTAAPYTESRLTRSVANERVGFPVVEQLSLNHVCKIGLSYGFSTKVAACICHMYNFKLRISLHVHVHKMQLAFVTGKILS